MKANDLRIGNMFYPINRNTPIGIPHMPIAIPYKIFSISVFEVEACTAEINFANVAKMDKFDIKDLSEIPLTKSILSRAELKYYMFLDKHWRFEFKSEYRGLAFYIGNEYIRDLRYLHEFQNFYFSLTGEELVFSSTEP